MSLINTNTISAREIQRNYRQIFNRVRKTNKPVVVISNNKPQAAIVSMDMLGKFNQLQQEADAFRLIDAIRNRNEKKNEESAYKQITEEVEQVRKKRYEKAEGSR
ncbi:type II toxin-antitoxin system Phd/YefM family antitoxin [Candidatus Roizmanbacteria bacterium]|nr:type II toxin-antitoxin system Phd/YefM family antitoxin [Candidatus Roizmanbacteria bacterium]